MKKCTIINVVEADVRTVTALGLNLYLRKYKRQAREMLKRTAARHVLYGIMHDQGSDTASCHVMALTPCTDEYMHRCFPENDRRCTPLVVSRR